ncbi:MAG TPA: lysozyme inhibitor LprI family protein [Magnetospirillaceae bacterium]|nr:lysozyme inhibitor LprI family protein [Magnetospirillaceae bacterium]
MKKPQLLAGLRFLFVLAFFAVAPAHAAGFDCAKATSRVETLICADQTLSALDDQMGNAYRAALTQGDPPPADIARNQKNWLSFRSGCARPDSNDAEAGACLTFQYRQRIEFLAHPMICRIDRLGDCHDTNQLIWSGGERAVREFLGPGKAADEMIGLLGGPPEDIQSLPNGWKLAAACRAHDCGSKGAAILTGSGQVMATAALTYRCFEIKCVDDYGLRISLRNEEDRIAATQAFEAWATAALADNREARLGETTVQLIGAR